MPVDPLILADPDQATLDAQAREQGDVWTRSDVLGMLWEARPNSPVPLPTRDGWHYATEKLKAYLCALTFNKSDGTDTGAIPFKLDPDYGVFFEWPDKEVDLQLPVLVFMPDGDPDHDYIGNVPYMDPGSEDVYGQGTALYEWSEHVQDFNLHVWCQDKPTRAALIAGLEIAFNPVQDISGVRLKLERYFNRTCIYTLNGGGRVEEPDAVRGRRDAKLQVNMRFNKVAKVGAADLIPSVEVTLYGPNDPSAQLDGPGPDLPGT